jgi:hypothetical protein
MKKSPPSNTSRDATVARRLGVPCNRVPLTLFLISLASPVAAEDLSSCERVLVRNSDSGSYSIAQNLSILTVASETDFNEAKKSLGVSGSGYYGGLPISGALN